MVKRSIEQEIRNKNFGIRNGNFEKNAVVKNQGTKQRVQRILGNGKPTGSVLKETIAVSATPSNPSPNSFMQQDERKSSRTRSPRGRSPVVECLDGLARITSKELATTHSVKSRTLQNACSTRPRVVVGLGKSALTDIVRLMNSRRKGLKRIMTKVLWLC